MAPHRSSPPPTRSAIQTILDRQRAGWMPRDGEACSDYVRRRAPPRPALWQPFDRSHWDRALADAVRRGETRATLPAFVFPVWIATNDDEVPRDDEWSRCLAVWAGGEILLEAELDGEPAFWARAGLDLVRTALVVEGRHHAPGIRLDRFGPFGVLADVLARATVDVVEACELAPPLPSPTREVPAFSTVAEPALEPDRLPADVAAALGAAIEWLTHIVDDEEGDPSAS